MCIRSRDNESAKMRTEELSNDLLTAFLLDMSALDHAKDQSLFGSINNSRSQDSVAMQKSRVGRKRVTKSDQLRDARLEASVLSQRLQELIETQLLTQALDRLLGVSCEDRMTWKECATRVRHARESAQDQKTELLTLMSSNALLLEYVTCLVSAQDKELSHFRLSVRRNSFAPNGDDAQLLHLMKSRLDYQHSQLDVILQQCVASMDSADKTVTHIHADGRGMDVFELELKPFDAQTIASTMQKYFEGRSLVRWQGENELYLRETVAAEEIGIGGSNGTAKAPSNDVRNQGVARGFVHQDQFVMLWQIASDWDSHASKLTTMRLWQSGWMVIRSFSQLGQGVSLAQANISVQIQSAHGSTQLVQDPDMMNIVQSLNAYGKRQIQAVDNLLIDNAMKCS